MPCLAACPWRRPILDADDDDEPPPPGVAAGRDRRRLARSTTRCSPVSDGRLSGVEGFVRWPHPVRSRAGRSPARRGGPPARAVRRLVLRTLCAQVVRWRKEKVLVPLVAAISGRTAPPPGIVRDRPQAVAAGSGRHARLELPRGAGRARARHHLLEIRRLGVRLASDDLGRERAPFLGADTLSSARRHAAAVARVWPRAASWWRVVAEGVETAAGAPLVAAGARSSGLRLRAQVSASDIHRS